MRLGEEATGRGGVKAKGRVQRVKRRWYDGTIGRKEVSYE